MCLVDPAPDGSEMGSDRPCLPGGDAYASHFETLHDQYPPALQKMFCSLTRIFVEKQFFGTAYAGLVRNAEGQLVAAKIGIRRSVLDEGLTLTQWASWKEQLSFGGHTDSYELDPGLPRIETTSPGGVNDFLYFVIAHEFGHLFDFTNRLNRHAEPDCGGRTGRDDECAMHPESWGALSWLTNQTPRPENEFGRRPGLCFYWCIGIPLGRDAVAEVYEGLARSNFLSSYATTQPWDDFADSLAYHLMERQLGTRYAIDTTQGARYDVMEKLGGSLFASKRRYLEALLGREDLRYP